MVSPLRWIRRKVHVGQRTTRRVGKQRRTIPKLFRCHNRTLLGELFQRLLECLTVARYAYQKLPRPVVVVCQVATKTRVHVRYRNAHDSPTASNTSSIDTPNALLTASTA